MIDRKKVIMGLECCQECDGYTCRNCCPYHDRNEPEDQSTCTCHLAHDALALLKEHEPKVMTLEEVEEGKPYWLEMRGIASEYAICKLNDHGDSTFLDFAVRYGDKTLESDGYGKTWRCWTSRPTDEQRKAVKWDG